MNNIDHWLYNKQSHSGTPVFALLVIGSAANSYNSINFLANIFTKLIKHSKVNNFKQNLLSFICSNVMKYLTDKYTLSNVLQTIIFYTIIQSIFKTTLSLIKFF